MPYSPRTDEFLVNSATAGNQSGPSVTRLANGNILVVWATPTTAQNSQFAITGQYFDAEGNKVGSLFFLTTLTIRGQASPDVTALPDGGFALSWTGFTSLSSFINVKFFNAAGQGVSNEIVVDFGNNFSVQDSEVSALANGSVVVVWDDSTDGMGNDPSVGGAIVASSGTITPLAVVTNQGGAQSDPTVATLANGNFVVTWTDSSGVGGDADTGIKAQIFDSAGNKVGGEFLANSNTAGAQIVSTIGALPSGGFVIVWNGGGQVFDAAGNKVGAEFPTVAAGPITVTSDGGFIVSHVAPDAAGNGVYAQQYGPDGTPVGGPFLVNVDTAGNQTDPTLLALPNDDLFVAWMDDSGVNGDTDQNGIMARLFTTGTLGGGGGDLFVGTPGDDSFLGLGGNDTFLMQQGGNDLTDGGADNDLFYYGGAYAGADTVIGGTGVDVLVLQGQYGDLDLAATSLAGVESIVLWAAGNNGFGGAGGSPNFYRIATHDGNVAAGGGLTLDARQLVAGEFVTFDGSAETDGIFALFGGEGDDSLTGGALGDQINGGGGIDIMAGGGGDDIYFVDHGGDQVIESASVAGGAFDAVYTNANYALRPGQGVELLAGNGLAPGQGIALQGNELAQTLVGGAANDILSGGGDDDFLTGNDGIDQLHGGAGIDVMAGGAGNDIYFVDNRADIIQEFAGGGVDTVYTNVDFTLHPSAEVEALSANGVAPGTPIALIGNGFAQSLTGASGNDYLFGGGGNDFIAGNAGDDQLDGGTGADVMAGGAGNDIYFVDNGGDIVQDSLGGGGFDAVYASADFALGAGALVELLAATGLAPGQGILLAGNDYGQSIVGGSGGDTLLGGGGNDLVDGGAGTDLIDGGAGLDGLRGGAGADIFRFLSASDSSGEGDSIYDFVSGTDKIDLSAIDANSGVPGDQAFTFIGAGAFTNSAGQLRAVLSDGVLHILGDTNGDGVADLHIRAYNAPSVSAGDFVL